MKIKKEKNKLSNKARIAIFTVVALILFISTVSLANAYLKPAIIQKEISKLEYNQIGNFNYIAYINDSIVYEGKDTLRPGEGTIFRNITKNIDAIFLYRISTNQNTKITGSYTITAQITTDDWNKTYTIIPETPINSNGTYTAFTEQFSIDYLFYENITYQIEEETAVDVKNPTLLIKANIILYIESNSEIIYETLNPTLTATLDQPTIEIVFGEDNQDSGEGTPIIQEVTNQNVINERNTWTIFFIASLVLIMLSIIILRRGEKLTITEKENQKIMKKYKEWIVDIDKEPKKSKKEILQVKLIEDLIKISEELGKPVFHYISDKKSHHYYILDGKETYEYKISNILLVEKTKIAKCPYCGTKINCKGLPGEKVHIKCPKCGKEGDTTI